jgi:chromosome segregation ATPase
LELAKQKEQEDHQATRDIVKSREGDLADARAQINALQDEISAGRRELDRLSAALAEREIALDQVSSALRSSEDQGRILKTMLDASTFQTARLSRTVSELEPMAERYKSQIASLQAAVEAEREAKEKAAIDRIEGLELLRAELRATAAKLEAATQRADTQEKMLLSARNSYREKLEELRTVERSVIDITMQLANMTRRAETAETDKAALASRVADLESVERGFEHRLNEINKILTEKETALLLARDQITFETSRLEEVQNIARSERTRYEAEMVELIKILDKERVNRTVLEGALLSNRRRHVMRGQEVDDEAAPLELEAVSTDDMSSGSVQEDNGETASISLTDDLAEAGAVILEFERTAVNHTPDHALAVAAIDAPLTDEARQAVPSAS